jgi:hypothetical protein
VVAAFVLVVFPGRGVAAEAIAEASGVARLERRVAYLAAALAEARAEVDALKARLDGEGFEGAAGVDSRAPGSAALRERDYRILDVNEELGMVVLDGGRRDGLRPGLMFSVFRGDQAVATVRVVEVRTAIAGAVIHRSERGGPGVRDRAVIIAGSRN